MDLLHLLDQKKTSIAIFGMGFVGLRIAQAFAQKWKVIGYDIDPTRIGYLNKGIDIDSGECSPHSPFKNILFTTSLNDLKDAKLFIVAVPTPIFKNKKINLIALKKACSAISTLLKKGDCVVFESSVYPGCTEAFCIPILEKKSLLLAGQDFMVAYSPERISPGDQQHTLTNIVKIVAGTNPATTEWVARLYRNVIDKVYTTTSIQVAEASKLLENIQRDVNIAFLNEYAQYLDALSISTQAVLQAAQTKWNFLPFTPGLVGGHCININGYYLKQSAQQNGYKPQLISTARKINEAMPAFIFDKITKHINQHPAEANPSVLIMGAAFKDNVADIKNAGIYHVYKMLIEQKIHTSVTDPLAPAQAMQALYGKNYQATPLPHPYHVIVVACAHQAYLHLTEEDFLALVGQTPCLLIDLKGLYHNQIKQLSYWGL